MGHDPRKALQPPRTPVPPPPPPPKTCCPGCNCHKN